MVIYCKSVHFGGFSEAGLSRQAFYEMASFSENRALRMLQESGESLPASRGCYPAAWPCGLARAGPGLSLLTEPHFSSGNSFIRHNVGHLSRIYPAGWRTDSSNYSPVEMWNGGCQIGMGLLGLEEAGGGRFSSEVTGLEPCNMRPGNLTRISAGVYGAVNCKYLPASKSVSENAVITSPMEFYLQKLYLWLVC